MTAKKPLAKSHNGRMSCTTEPLGPTRAQPRFGTTAACANDVALVGLRGELDVAACGSVAATVRALLDADARELLFDLTELTYLDCAGLGALLDAARAAAALDARCYVFRANDQPAMLLEWARRRGIKLL